MAKTLAGLIGAMTVLAVSAPIPPANASAAMQVSSYADLLKPVPNAVEVLQALDEQPAPEATVEEVQYRRYYRHHHHHWYRRRYAHHHHHHRYWRRSY